MLSLRDCVDLCGLSDDELTVIAEHEHVPTIVAAEIGNELLGTAKGLYRLHTLFLDSLEQAARGGQREKEKLIGEVYARFRAQHPMPRML
jgi:predicted DNA-binding ribbon-helix-helix protein